MIITKSMMMMTNSSTITISVSAFSIIQSTIDGFGESWEEEALEEEALWAVMSWVEWLLAAE